MTRMSTADFFGHFVRKYDVQDVADMRDRARRSIHRCDLGRTVGASSAHLSAAAAVEADRKTARLIARGISSIQEYELSLGRLDVRSVRDGQC